MKLLNCSVVKLESSNLGLAIISVMLSISFILALFDSIFSFNLLIVSFIFCVSCSLPFLVFSFKLFSCSCSCSISFVFISICFFVISFFAFLLFSSFVFPSILFSSSSIALEFELLLFEFVVSDNNCSNSATVDSLLFILSIILVNSSDNSNFRSSVKLSFILIT